MAEKACTKCGVVKPATAEYFYPQRWCKLNLRPDCLVCMRKAQADRRAKQDPQKRVAYRLAYRAKNREMLKANDRAYYKANKPRLIEQMKEYNRKNREAYNAKLRKWRKEHPEQVQVWVRNRRAKLKGLHGQHSLEDITALLFEQKGLCVYCKCDISVKYQVDHVMPVALGGSNDKSNLQLLCRPCNLHKRAKHPAEYAKEIGALHV